MPTIIIASLEPREGRTATVAALGALLAGAGRTVRLLRLRGPEEDGAPVEDDARTLAAVPGCTAPRGAASEQEALSEASGVGDATLLIEAPPGMPAQLAERLSARVVLVTSHADDVRLGDLATAAQALADRFVGVVATRQPNVRLDAVRSLLVERGLTPIAVIPEDALLAGPSMNEMAEALHASRLVETGNEDEAIGSIMIGPISADPGQPYFQRHETKAVLNRFDKMDLHLAALATEPDCLIITGGQAPGPYFLDRLQGSDAEVTVLLSPADTVRTMEVLDELYGRTRFIGTRKFARVLELTRERVPLDELTATLS